jgi:hypothetical protein
MRECIEEFLRWRGAGGVGFDPLSGLIQLLMAEDGYGWIDTIVQDWCWIVLPRLPVGEAFRGPVVHAGIIHPGSKLTPQHEPRKHWTKRVGGNAAV